MKLFNKCFRRRGDTRYGGSAGRITGADRGYLFLFSPVLIHPKSNAYFLVPLSETFPSIPRTLSAFVVRINCARSCRRLFFSLVSAHVARRTMTPELGTDVYTVGLAPLFPLATGLSQESKPKPDCVNTHPLVSTKVGFRLKTLRFNIIDPASCHLETFSPTRLAASPSRFFFFECRNARDCIRCYNI